MRANKNHNKKSGRKKTGHKKNTIVQQINNEASSENENEKSTSSDAETDIALINTGEIDQCVRTIERDDEGIHVNATNYEVENLDYLEAQQTQVIHDEIGHVQHEFANINLGK